MDCHHYDCETCPYPDCVLSGVEALRRDAQEKRAQQNKKAYEYKQKPKPQKDGKEPKMTPEEYREYRLAYFKRYYAEHREEICLKRKLKRTGMAKETKKEYKGERGEYYHAYYMTHREQKKAYEMNKWRAGNG